MTRLHPALSQKSVNAGSNVLTRMRLGGCFDRTRGVACFYQGSTQAVPRQRSAKDDIDTLVRVAIAISVASPDEKHNSDNRLPLFDFVSQKLVVHRRD